MSKLILIVDDDQPTCMLWARHLSFAGWDIQIANDTETAEENLLQYRPHAMLLDVMLRDERSGWELLMKVRCWEWARKLPVLVISAVEAPRRAFLEGATSFFLKPCSPQKIIDHLNLAFLAIE